MVQRIEYQSLGSAAALRGWRLGGLVPPARFLAWEPGSRPERGPGAAKPAPLPGLGGVREPSPGSGAGPIASADRILADAFAAPRAAGGYRGLRALVRAWLADDEGDPDEVVTLLESSRQRAPFHRLGYVLSVVERDDGPLPPRGRVLLEACRARVGRGRPMLVPRGASRAGRFEPRWNLVLNDPHALPLGGPGDDSSKAGSREAVHDAADACRDGDGPAAVFPEVLSPGEEVGDLAPRVLADWAGRDRRAFERLCGDLFLLEARDLGEVLEFRAPDDVDRADHGIDLLVRLASDAARGAFLGPGLTVVQVKCRDPRRAGDLAGELRRGAEGSLRSAIGYLGTFDRFVLVTNLLLASGKCAELERALRKAAARLVGSSADPPEVHILSASGIAALVRTRWPQLLGYLGIEPDLVPWRAVRERLLVQVAGRRLLPRFRGRIDELKKLREALAVEGGETPSRCVVLVAPRFSGATRLAYEALEPVAPRAFWWHGPGPEGRRRLEKVLHAAGGEALWVVLDRLLADPRDFEEWTALLRLHPRARLLLIHDRPFPARDTLLLELGELDHASLDELAGGMVRALGCSDWGPGDGFRWQRALAARSDGLPGVLVHLAEGLATASTRNEREEVLARRVREGVLPDDRELEPGERRLLHLVALVDGIRAGRGLPGVPPPEELAAIAELVGDTPAGVRSILLRLAERRVGLRPVPGAVKPEIGLRDALTREAIDKEPELVHRALAHPVLRARAAEGLGRLRGDRLARAFASRLVGEVRGTIRSGGPATVTDLAMLASLVFVVPREVVRAVRDLLDRRAPAEARGRERRLLVEILEEGLRGVESALEALALLERLALAENEKWANNATGLFRGAFDPRNPFVPLSLEDRLAHLREMAGSGDPDRLRLLFSVLPVVFRGNLGGWRLPGPEHWLPDLAPPVSWKDLGRYRSGAMDAWARAIRGAAALLGTREAIASFRENFVAVLLAAVAGNDPGLAREACDLVRGLSLDGIVPGEDPSWLAALEEWRRRLGGWAEDAPHLATAIARVDRHVQKLRADLFPGGRKVRPFVLARRWLGPAVSEVEVAAGRDRRPEKAARRLVEAFLRDASALGGPEIDWLVSEEAVHGHLFWRLLGEALGADPRVLDLLVERLSAERGPEALGTFLRGAARKGPDRVREALSRLVDRHLRNESLSAPGDVLLRVLLAHGMEHVDSGDLGRVLRESSPSSRVARGVLMYPASVSVLASLPPADLREIARQFPGPEGAPVRLSCLAALTEAAEREKGEEGTKGRLERLEAAWKIVASLPSGLEDYDRWRWRHVLGRLAALAPERFAAWIRALSPPQRDVVEWSRAADDLAEVLGDLAAAGRRVPGQVEAVLDAVHHGGLAPFGAFELARWIDPARDGDTLLSWARGRGDRRAWLLASCSIDPHREGGLELAVRLVEACEDGEIREEVMTELAARALSLSGRVEDVARRLRDLRARAAELADSGSSAPARALGKVLVNAIEDELEVSRERLHDTWLDWDGTLGDLRPEDFLRLPVDSPARRRVAVRLLESLPDREVLETLTEEDIRRAVESGEVRDEVAGRWRAWLARREERR